MEEGNAGVERHVSSRALALCARAAVVSGLLLIWWGATVTTRNYGLAVPGWNWLSSFGAVFPEGWTKVAGVFFEHGHRLLAGLTGVLTAVLFAWIRLRPRRTWAAAVELALVFLTVALVIDFVRRGAALPAGDPTAQRPTWFFAAGVLGAGCLTWLTAGFLGRQWSTADKAAALAILLVALQAILGGLRVTEISDAFAVVHGCVGQIFFCVLVFLAMVTSKRWSEARDLVPAPALTGLRALSLALLAGVFIQLVLAATMRHTHRVGLAIEDFPLSRGRLIPAFLDAEGGIDFDLAVSFAHRAWAVVVLILAVWVLVFARRRLDDSPGIRRLAYALAPLLVAQILLGALTTWTKKGLLPTNTHVLTGLCILSVSFALAVLSLIARARSPLLAETRETETAPPSSPVPARPVRRSFSEGGSAGTGDVKTGSRHI